MVPANKILTVTYGTFSCTLEGFDDPFTAMTEIAEYFRDLASKDRYFGAEPPTPDMEKLEQITAASMNGPVSGDNSSGRLVLRPGTVEPNLSAAVEDSAADEKAAQEQAVEDDGLAFEDDAFEDEAPAEDVVPEQIAEDEEDAETASEKLARLRGVATDETSGAESDEFEEDSFEPVEARSQDEAISQADLSDATATEFPAEDAVSSEADDLTEADDSVDSPWAEDLPLEDEAEGAGAEIEDAPFEALAVEDHSESAVELDEDMAEDEGPAEAVEDVSDIEDEDGTGLAQSELPYASTETEIEAAEIEVAAGDAISDHTPAEADADTAVQTAGEDTLAADLAAMFSPRVEEEPEAPAPEQSAARVTVRKVRKRVRADDTAAAAATAAEPEEDRDEDADLMAELAAIEAELARDATGATAPEASHDEEDDDVEESAVSGEDAETDADDPDLLTELAVIQAEAAPETTDEEDASDDAEAIEDAKPTEAEPNDLERLFAATDSRLSGEDASRRHANISHLKAAVAARRADDTIETEKTDVSGAYRKDLANTVRPRRKSAETGDAGEEPRPERGAPLVLISEQRVEPAPEPEEEAPAAKAPEVDIAEGLSKGLRAPDTGDDFEQFAIDVGAVDLPDVLEAAAVYSATVMGQESFSRPRLLHLAAEAVDDLSREDGLRGFGQLLRDGTIRKVGRGTFTLGTESRFQTKASRRAG